jgi:hypothetical protein
MSDILPVQFGLQFLDCRCITIKNRRNSALSPAGKRDCRTDALGSSGYQNHPVFEIQVQVSPGI